MSDLDRFQKEYGGAWANITQSPAFVGAFSIANMEKLQGVAALTNEEIQSHGKIILAGLRDHLQYENALLSLNTRKEFVFQDMPRETYPSPIEEATDEEQAETRTDNQGATFSISEFKAPPEVIEQPRQKRKYTRRKKKRK